MLLSFVARSLHGLGTNFGYMRLSNPLCGWYRLILIRMFKVDVIYAARHITSDLDKERLPIVATTTT